MPLSTLHLKLNTQLPRDLQNELSETSSKTKLNSNLRINNGMRIVSCMRSLAELSKLSYDTFQDLTILVNQTQVRIENLQSSTHNLIQKEGKIDESFDFSLKNNNDNNNNENNKDDDELDEKYRDKIKKLKKLLHKNNFLERSVISSLNNKIINLKKLPIFNELEPYKDYLVKENYYIENNENSLSSSNTSTLPSSTSTTNTKSISNINTGFTFTIKHYSEYFSNPNFFLNEWKITQEKRMLHLERVKKQQRLDQKRRNQLNSEYNQHNLETKKKVIQWRDRYNLSSTNEFLSPKKTENLPRSQAKIVGKDLPLEVYQPTTTSYTTTESISSSPSITTSSSVASKRVSISNNRKSIRLQLQAGLQNLSATSSESLQISVPSPPISSNTYVKIKDEKELKYRLKNIIDVTFNSYTFKPPSSSSSQGFVSPTPLSDLSSKSSFYKSLVIKSINPPPPPPPIPSPPSAPSSAKLAETSSITTSPSLSSDSSPSSNLYINSISTSPSLSPPNTQSTAHISISNIYDTDEMLEDVENLMENKDNKVEKIESDSYYPTFEEVISSSTTLSPPPPPPPIQNRLPPPPPPAPPARNIVDKKVQFSDIEDKESARMSRSIIKSMRFQGDISSSNTTQESDRPISGRHLISKSIRLDRQKFATLLTSVHGYIEEEMIVNQEKEATTITLSPPPPPPIPSSLPSLPPRPTEIKLPPQQTEDKDQSKIIGQEMPPMRVSFYLY